MDAALIATLCGLAPAVLWGVGNFFGAKSSKAIGSTTTAYYLTVSTTLLYLVAYALFFHAGASFTTSGVVITIVSAVIFNLALILFYAGLAAGPVSVVTPIVFSFPLITTLSAVLAFGASISGWQILAVLVIVLGVGAAAGLLDRKRSERGLGKGPLLAIVAALLYGIAYAGIAQAVDSMGWQSTTLVQVVTGAVFFTLLVPFVQRQERVFANFKAGLTSKSIIIAAVLGIVGIVIISIGFGYDPTSGAIVTAASAVSPIVTVLLALKHFDEELNPSRLIGIGITVLGVILLSIG